MFAEIVFPLPFRKAFTYKIPSELEELATVGVRVAAPFGKRTLTGFVINVMDETDTKEKLKEIYEILDDRPIFNADSLKFYEWMSEYYLSSLGEALKNSAPAGADVESKKRVEADKEMCAELYEREKNKNSAKAKILKALSEKPSVLLPSLQKEIRKKNIYTTLRSLQKLGALTVHDEVIGAKVKPKTAKFIKLIEDKEKIFETIPEIERRSPKQTAVLLELLSRKEDWVLQSELLEKMEASASSINSLEEKKLLIVAEREIERSYTEVYNEKSFNLKLNEAQSKAIERIEKDLVDSRFNPFLIRGVTGSGKTQVYIELAKKAIELGRDVLILVPEISLTPQMTARLYNNFKELVAVIHSRMARGERYDAWRGIVKGKYRVVVGARSALFAPLKNVGLIVVDEEHDASYKQFENVPRYQARDSAIMLAKIFNAPVVLGSATPSIESMHNARTGKFELIELKERVDNAKMPAINLVNVIVEKKKKRLENVFSKTLLEKIGERLSKKEGVIILQNRRGFSTQIYCDDCGEIESCESCSVGLVYHISGNKLVCHYCGFSKKAPPACRHCGSLALKYFGAGTQRVEDEIEYYFPEANIRRIDSDTVARKGALGETLNAFAKGEIDILVGTQIVSKGLDFSRVTLVGVISAETTLWLPDFRANERTFQLLTQVAGRAGRSKEPGEVIIQTQNDKHFTLQKVETNDYEGLYAKEILEREKYGYPPFTRLCLIEFKDLEEHKVIGAARDFYEELKKNPAGILISTPSPAVIARIKGYYRYHILIKSSKKIDASGSILRKAVINSFSEFNRTSRFRDVKTIIDVDPQNIM